MRFSQYSFDSMYLLYWINKQTETFPFNGKIRSFRVDLVGSMNINCYRIDISSGNSPLPVERKNKIKSNG